MNYACYLTCLLGFFAGVPLLLVVRFLRPSRMPWWLLVVLSAVLGWVLSNLAVHFFYRNLDELLEQAGGVNGAPQSLVDEWQNDGAKRAIALVAGWIYGVAYLLLCLGPYGLLVATLRRHGRKRPSGTTYSIRMSREEKMPKVEIRELTSADRRTAERERPQL